MVWGELLLKSVACLLAISTTLIASPLLATTLDNPCLFTDQSGKACPTSVDASTRGGSVDLRAAQDSGGSKPSKQGGAPSASGGNAAGGGAAEQPAPPPGPQERLRGSDGITAVLSKDYCDVWPCSVYRHIEQEDPVPVVLPGDPRVHLSDLANFRPAQPAMKMQPDGWSIVGLETNVYAVAKQNAQSGTLLGKPAQVRFTPVGFAWNYGDGTKVHTVSAGYEWESGRAGEFAQTPTSHIYSEKGTYVVRVTVVYSAQYRFDGDRWRAVPGTLSVDTSPREVLVTGVTTVLENPH